MNKFVKKNEEGICITSSMQNVATNTLERKRHIAYCQTVKYHIRTTINQ